MSATIPKIPFEDGLFGKVLAFSLGKPLRADTQPL